MSSEPAADMVAGDISRVRWSPCGKYLVALLAMQGITVDEFATGKSINALKLEDHKGIEKLMRFTYCLNSPFR